MQDNYIECPELTGKTIQMVRIYRDVGDGTSFTCCVTVRPAVEATLYKGGVGTPETIRDYKF